MIKRLLPLFSILIIVSVILWCFYGTMPRTPSDAPVENTAFSTARALEHVKALGQTRHFVGSEGHSEAKEYLVEQLEQIGLSVEIQSGTSLSKRGILVKPENILARIEGTDNGKSLLLLSHYDSAVHSSFGASDAASGVATILEGVRAYLASGKKPLNDIVIAFTDAEEVGLNGAELFVREHPWAKEVGLALNFEARGSGGPSLMLLETVAGNEELIEHFTEANPKYPVANSLSYSVYKMLPNDTDLTVLREEGDINGFNFAFIDDHFDYHTALDTPENLDLNTLAHQGSYLMPLLHHFGEVPLSDLDSSEDLIYFDVPLFNMLSYPFSWILPMLVLAILLFLGVTIYGIMIKNLQFRAIAKGFVPLLLTFSLTGLLGYFLWQFCLFIYPQYLEMEHGFTYNGYYYIAAVIFLSLGTCFYVYNRFRREKQHGALFVAPLVLWIVICALASFFLKGASYLIIPVYFGIVQLFLLVQFQRPHLLVQTLLSLPSIVLLLPLIHSLPVALGLKVLFVTAILIALLWTLLWPVFRQYAKLQLLGFFSFLCFFVLMVIAHFQSEFTEDRPKPNSLVYLYDADTNSATWNTYDLLLDEWTSPYFEGKSFPIDPGQNFDSKYSSGFTKIAKASNIGLQAPEIVVRAIDSTSSKEYEIDIIPKRELNRIEIFTSTIIDFEEFIVNGMEAQPLTSEANPLHIFKRRWSNRLLTYFATDRDTLSLKFTLKGEELPEFMIYEASNNLLEQEALEVSPRAKAMIPRPFVLNDAVIIKKSISLE